MIFVQLTEKIIINVQKIEYIRYNYISHEARHKDHPDDAFILIIKFSGDKSVNLHFKNSEAVDAMFKFIRKMMAEQSHIFQYMPDQTE